LTDFPLVTIVTPSLNQGRFLEETICSVLNQDYAPLEYIIVDGGSSDGSQNIIERYAARLACWKSEPDQGQTDAINKGFQLGKGEIFAWLNSDDTYLPQAVSRAVNYFLSYPEAGMVYGDANLIDERSEIIGKFPARQTDYRRLRRGYVHIPQQAAFFRSALWKRVGPLDPSFFFAMDYDLWVRISRLAPLRYIPQTWANFRLHSTGKTSVADDRCWPEMVRIHRRDGGSWFSILELKARIRPWLYSWLPLKVRLSLRRML
jgi:glycosyltransferase involved in cell wall biosynthesis